MFRHLGFTGACLAIILLTSCHPSRVFLSPTPSHIERIEGYASLRISTEQDSVRSNFSFLFQLPDQGKFDVSNPFGQTLYQIIITRGEAFLVIPSKKVYWKGEEEEIIIKFFGFQLSLTEMFSLLSGQWPEEEGQSHVERGQETWTFEKDENGRIKAANRGNLRFEMREFFKDTPYARVLEFEHPLSEGRLRILHIGFDQSVKRNMFEIGFMQNFGRKSWAEILEIIDSAR